MTQTAPLGDQRTGRFAGKLVVVAGGSSGIGRATVELFRAQGAEVHTFSDNDPETTVDLTNEAQVEGFFDSLPREPDIAVNAVGNANLELILEQPVEEFRRIVDVELVAAYTFIQKAARLMVRSGKPGSIVSVSSEQEQVASRGLSSHCAAKAGLAMLTKVAALELGSSGIRVNAVGPGATNTPLTAFLREVPTYVAGIAASTPLGPRWGEPLEIADAIAFLASEDARWITGVSLRVDGGQSLVFVPDVLDALKADEVETDSKVIPSRP